MLTKRLLLPLLILAMLFVAITAVTAGPGHPTEGQPAPPINLKTIDGQPFSLDKVKAEVVVLDFWATWCPPCRKGLPLLQEFNNWAKKEKKSVKVYAVNLREHASKVRQYWRQQKFNMHVLMDTDGGVAQAYGVSGIPHTAILHKGKIVSVHVGYSPQMTDTLKREVSQLLGEK